MSALSTEQIVDLLEYIGVDKLRVRKNGKEVSGCCPVHGENNPSFGVSVELQSFHCFSCGASGDLSWLLFKSIDSIASVYEADEFLKDRYGVDFSHVESMEDKILRYEESEKLKPQRLVLPRDRLAPFRSGRETFGYFFDRGFTKETMREFQVGRDLEQETVTVPLFWADGQLGGIIGRKIDPDTPKNYRYQVYDFQRGRMLFPLDHFQAKDGTVILVEGILDAMWMHQCGYTNTLATLGINMTWEQAKLLRERCDKIIDMTDNDDGGDKLRAIIQRRLRGISYRVVTYPAGKKDPQECTPKQIARMLAGAKSPVIRRITRIS